METGLMMADKPIGNMAEVYFEIGRQALEDRRQFDERMGPLHAEIVPECSPRWHVLITSPNHERIAASHLIGRGFGIYLPEFDAEDVMRRGRKVETQRLMLPGYLFVFVWDVSRHVRRVRTCPGVYDFLYMQDGLEIATIPDRLIDALRVEENKQRPLKMLMGDVAYQKKAKKRWRKNKQPKPVAVEDTEIIAVHAYSPFIEALRLDDEGRIGAFHKAIGLA